ncbi:MAG: hypothetical protein PHS54_01595 [Clostridia bacterium]|nr:hypothetical protein [Clostridia bacterium]
MSGRYYLSISDIPYNINQDTKFFWKAFKEQTLKGNGRAAIIAYCEFFQARNEAFIKNEREEHHF